jgi:hypothetical protein
MDKKELRCPECEGLEYQVQARAVTCKFLQLAFRTKHRRTQLAQLRRRSRLSDHIDWNISANRYDETAMS